MKKKVPDCLFFFFFFFLTIKMYPEGPKPEHDQFPLQDTQFSNQPPVHRSPFEDPYPEDQPHFDKQPLLTSPAYPPTQYPTSPPPPNFPGSPAVQQPYPPFNNNPSPVSPGVPAYFNPAPPSPNMHYGQAPRRQPRRFKTSKNFSFYISRIID